MANPSATFSSDAREASDPTLPLRAGVVIALEELLATLFPDAPSLDLITVEDVLRRYPLTGLGAPALTAIEQSRRIVRARDDYGQSGLLEFHIGLIYLNYADYRAAANGFALARQPWQLANDPAAICLSHYAQGQALEHAQHFEPAMLHYGRAERLLGRPVQGREAMRRTQALTGRLAPLLTQAQKQLRERLWPEDRPPRDVPVANFAAPSHGVAAEPRTPPMFGRSLAARPSRVPLPISNLPGGLNEVTRGPVPGHIVVDDRFGWYVVATRAGDFLPGVLTGTSLLADSDWPETPAGRDYVIAGSAQPGLGCIRVQPVAQAGAVPFCYLGYRESTATGVQMFLDETGRPMAAGAAVVLAVVEGAWYGLAGQTPAAWPEARE